MNERKEKRKAPIDWDEVHVRMERTREAIDRGSSLDVAEKRKNSQGAGRGTRC